MTVTIRLGIVFLASVSCVHLRKLCSSYFTISYLKQAREDSDKIAEFNADTELICALQCNTKDICDEATFYRDSKKCFLFQKKAKGSTEPYAGDDNTKSSIVTMRKESIKPLNESTGGCASNDDKHQGSIDDVKDDGDSDDDDDDGSDDSDDSRRLFPPVTEENTTKGASCSDILRQNSSSKNGIYNITVGNITWKTWCEMTGIPKCGGGAWTLVMSINGSKKTFSYDSHQWTSKASYQTASQRQETKLPGYWLSSFTRTCVWMQFPSRDENAFILLNYTGKSLYSALHEGIKKTWPADFSAMKQFSWTPSNIDTSCFVQGFNLTAPHPWMTIKSRVGVQSQPQQCAPPYLVRGVGIAYQLYYPRIPEISCGEIISYPVSKPETHAAFCRIYIQ